MTAPDYRQFLELKSQNDTYAGFDPLWMPAFLFDFQTTLVDWATRKGKAAIFADCGLGKTPMQLVWAENVVRKTNRPVLIVTPLAVTGQTLLESQKFDIDATRDPAGKNIVLTNYERLHHFDPANFAGMVCDESSILKNFDGVRRQAITDFMRKMDYRLLCSATAAPNDYIELGTSSEALGQLGYMDMLGRFFKNDLNNSATGRQWGGAAKWRFKGHAQEPFWRWVCSWARALRRPSDLGFDDARFILPALIEREHVVEARTIKEGTLFATAAIGMREEREEMRRTITERCERAAALAVGTDPVVSWCHFNAEGDLLTKLIPGAVQVSGQDEPEEKEAKFLAFASGQTRVLVIKPKIGAWGLNWQHCHRMTFFPSHSFEQYYQAVRRSWRFGQTQPVEVEIVTTDGGIGVMKNLQRKAAQSDEMFSRLVHYMNDAMALSRATPFTTETELPVWL